MSLRVLQIIDSLQAGGAERIAVSYANGLSKLGVTSFICATRDEGPLVNTIHHSVGYVYLNRKSTFDGKAVLKLRAYIVSNKIDIIHAHSTSYFIAILVKLLLPKVKIVWHDHYGNSELLSQRSKRILHFCSKHFAYIFSVNQKLKHWAEHSLSCKHVEYIKNFPVLNSLETNLTQLQGNSGKRMLCLANLREQKNHLLLLKAFSHIIKDHPDWTLHCVGKDFKDAYSKDFFQLIEDLQLHDSVFFYDSKPDVLHIMNQCQVGILSSKSEGLPLALLEYGMAKLPVITTNVGDCGELINNSDVGLLIESGNLEQLVNAMQTFIAHKALRLSCANNFYMKVKTYYSEESILRKVIEIYTSILKTI